MKCPVCSDQALMMSERNGVEIDYCPKCRGVWLDRGELDKIIERSEGQGSGAARGPAVQGQPSAAPVMHSQPPAHGGVRKLDDSDYGYVYQDPTGRPVYQKKRKGFLRELFDIG